VEISEIILNHFSPYIFRKSHKSFRHNYEQFRSNRVKSLFGGKLPPLNPNCNLRVDKQFSENTNLFVKNCFSLMMTFYCDCYYFTPKGEKYCDEYDCLSVCISVCLSVWSCNSKTTRPIFTKFLSACYLSPWLGPLLTALRYVLNTSFVGDVVFSYHGASGQNQARRSIYVMFTRLRHQLDVRQLVVGGVHWGWSLLSTIALYCLIVVVVVNFCCYH